MKKKLMIESGGVLHKPAGLKEKDGSGKWSASIWKLDERNLNGRIYGTELAKRIVAENKVTVAYDGHDVDWRTGEEYGITKAVASNPRIENGELRVDIDFVDEAYEALLAKLVDKGVAIGVSSVGYGEEDEVGHVNPASYELVRYFDFVTCPAGEVYATMESKAKRKQSEGSEETVVESEASKAMARKRQKVAEGFAELIVGDRK